MNGETVIKAKTKEARWARTRALEPPSRTCVSLIKSLKEDQIVCQDGLISGNLQLQLHRLSSLVLSQNINVYRSDASVVLIADLGGWRLITILMVCRLIIRSVSLRIGVCSSVFAWLCVCLSVRACVRYIICVCMCTCVCFIEFIHVSVILFICVYVCFISILCV